MRISRNFLDGIHAIEEHKFSYLHVGKGHVGVLASRKGYRTVDALKKAGNNEGKEISREKRSKKFSDLRLIRIFIAYDWPQYSFFLSCLLKGALSLS